MKVGTLPSEIEELEIILRNLNFADNFKSAQVTVDIDTATEVSIPNPFNDGTIPTQYIVVMNKRRSAGTTSISMGDAAWTRAALSLRNDGTANSTITVVFLR